MSERDGFLQRWSKRKLEEKAAAEAPKVASVEPVQVDLAQVPSLEPEEPFDVSLLPSIEELTGDSDIAAFLQKGVPEALKNAAMRKIWASNPLFSQATGPLDYAWDYNDPHGVPGFGPLAANFDTSEMLKSLFKDPEPPSSEVVEAAGIGKDMPSALADGTEPAENADATDPLQQDDKQLLDKETDRLEQPVKQEQFSDADTVAGTGFRKRHGGAVPI